MPPLTQVSQSKPLFEFIRKQQENEKFARSVEIGGTFLLISFFLIFAIKPTAYTISSLLGEIRSKEVLVKQLRSKITNVIQAQEAFSQVQGKYKLIEASLPDSPRYNHAYNQLYGSSQDSGILLESIGFNPENNNPYPPESHIASFVSPVSVRTSFSQVVDFLGRLAANRRLINIREISLQMEKDKNQDIPTNFIKFSYTNQYLFWNQENEKK